MKLENVKNFFRPDWWKFGFTIVSTCMAFLVSINMFDVPVGPFIGAIMILTFPAYLLTAVLIQSGALLIGLSWTEIFIMLAVFAAYWYAISCVLSWAYGKVRNKRK